VPGLSFSRLINGKSFAKLNQANHIDTGAELLVEEK
jgi:hypothetical protein